MSLATAVTVVALRDFGSTLPPQCDFADFAAPFPIVHDVMPGSAAGFASF